MSRMAKAFYDLDMAFTASFGTIPRELVVPTRRIIPQDYVGLPITVDPHCLPDQAFIRPVVDYGGQA